MQQQNKPPKIFPKKIGVLDVFGWFWVVCCSVDGVDLISQTEPAGSRPSFWSVSSGSMAGTWLEHEPPENRSGFLLNSKWFTASHIGFCMCNLTWTQFGSEVKIEGWFQLIQNSWNPVYVRCKTNQQGIQVAAECVNPCSSWNGQYLRKNFGGIQLRVLQADAGNFQRFMTQIVFDIVLMEQTNSTFVDVNICIWKIL